MPGVTKPCDVLTVIPDASPKGNRYLVRNERPVAEGLAINKKKVELYKCDD